MYVARLTLRSLFFVILALAFALLAACGDGAETGDSACEPACEVGVCSGGQCLNPESCEDDEGCLTGFSCLDGACQADIACSESEPCERGSCVAGACVNDKLCVDNGGCVEGFTCRNGRCEEALCENVTCDRGVCDVSSGECVNMGACSPLNEEKACLSGYRCYGGQCATDEEICADISCARGVCDPIAQTCADAESCTGEMECLQGRLCVDGECKPNVCDSQAVTCERGICDPISGGCVNAESCTDESGCTDGFFCVDGTCTAQDEACGACPGNQICDYDGVTTVACAESAEGCHNALDCVDTRVCRDGACAEATACQADDHEPNDTEAVDYLVLPRVAGAVAATLCEGDVDLFDYDLGEDDDFTGTLVVGLDFARADVGLGEVTVDLLTPDGTVEQTATSAGDGRVRLSADIGPVQANWVYRIRVQADGALSTAGLRYGLFVDLVDATVAAACAAAEPLDHGVAISGNTNTASSTELGSSCIFDAGSPELVYSLEISERSFVDISMTPTDASLNLTVGLRSQCVADAAEMRCADEVGPSLTEHLQLALDPGVYYVVVQGSDRSASGPFTLRADVEPIVCDSSMDSCSSSITSSMCNARGTGFETVACDSGCDEITGRCDRVEADVCYAPIDATAGYSGTINWAVLSNDYDPGSNGCVPTVGGYFASRETQGRDAAFQVDLGPGEVVEVEVSTDSSAVEGHSIYVVGACDDVTASCLQGANSEAGDDIERLTYTNRGSVAETVYVIVDTEQGTVGTSEVDIAAGPVVCQRGDQQCNGNDLETCKSSGIGWDAKTCTFGCDAATSACVLPANNTCGGAIDVSAGGSFQGNIEDFNADYNPGFDGCVDAAGREGVYVVHANPDDIVRASVSGPFDSALYAVTDCGAIADTCVRGTNAGYSGDTESIVTRVPDSGTLYLIVDSDNLLEAGAFTLDVLVEAPVCTPFAATCSSGVLDYCDALGQQTFSHTCSSGACSSRGDACDAPSGNLCAEAIDANAGGTFTGSYDTATDNYNPRNPNGSSSTSCTGYGAEGADTVYFVDLQPGERLGAELIAPNADASLYVITDCGNPSGSCLDGDDSGEPEEVSYINNQAVVERVFIVADGYSSFASGSYTLTISLEQLICQPDTTTCDANGEALETCNSAGTALSRTLCDFQGCIPGKDSCNAGFAGDTCGDAIDATGGGSFGGSFADFSPDYDPGSGGCTAPWPQSGPDIAYVVFLAGGETLTATVNSSENTGLYLVTNCADVANTCVAGEDSGISGESVSYSASVGQMVFVIVDTFTTNPTGDFTVEIDIQ